MGQELCVLMQVKYSCMALYIVVGALTLCSFRECIAPRAGLLPACEYISFGSYTIYTILKMWLCSGLHDGSMGVLPSITKVYQHQVKPCITQLLHYYLLSAGNVHHFTRNSLSQKP